MSNFFTPEFNNESAIAPWNASLEPTKAIIPQLDANRVLTGGVGEEVNIPTLTPQAYDNIILPDAALTRMANGAIADSNSSLPDSSVDLLTGQAMSEVYGDLTKFAADPDFAAKLNVAFGENWDAAAAKALAEEWFQGDFSDIPPMKIISSAEIDGANGAFAAATDTIYLSKEFLAGNVANPAAVADVLLEEIGHSVDARLNVTDSPGDEGAIFAAVVQGKVLSAGEIQGLKGEDDSGTIAIDGYKYVVEKQLSQWKAEYFNNTNLTGTPVFSRYENSNFINYDWGNGGPGNGVRNDQFSARWTGSFNFQGGDYTFKQSVDDGMRVWVDNNLIHDTWNGRNAVDYSRIVPMTPGLHTVKVEYKEWTGAALAKVSWESTPPNNRFLAQFYNNTDLSGTPVFSRYDNSINYDWGTGGPGNGVRNDQFSARWTGSFNFEGGDYTFKQSVDDGMRVWVDNNLIHDTWNGRNAVDYSRIVPMTPGLHTVKVEYKEWTGAALAKVSWESTPPNNRFLAQFYNNTDLSGTPVFSRYENSINYDWGTGGPGNGVRNDQFSARWTGSFNFQGGDYTFKQSVDDGMRVWVDNNLIHDTWNGRNAVDYSRVVAMTPGQHTVKVEYKEWTDSALAKVSWEKGNPDIDIRLDFIGNFTQSQKNLIERAAQNWENIITKDMVPSGVLNVAVTDGSTHFNGSSWGPEWAITDFPYPIGTRPTPNQRYNLRERFDNTRGIDYDTEMQFKSSSLADVERRGLLVRLAMHELGHALYLDEAQYDGTLGLDSLMDRDGIDSKITEGMYRELERMGYGVNRNPSINWS